MGHSLLYGWNRCNYNRFREINVRGKYRNLKKSEATKFFTENGIIKSLEINNSDKIYADNIICNADPPNVYDHLINNKKNSLFDWKEKEWTIPWDYLFTILELKKVYENVASYN